MRTLLPLKIACVTIIVALASVPARGQGQDLFDTTSIKDRIALSPEQEAMLRSKQDSINREASMSTANEWIGRYTSEDSPVSGTQFVWAPDGGFVVWWNTCSHQWRDRVNFGRAEFRSGAVRLTSELMPEGQIVYALAGDLVTVKWGDQHYLVPLDRLIAFCYAARNAGRSNEINEFFLKESDREKRRFGLPAVPPEYKKYLAGRPIMATIVEVKSRGESLGEAFTLNAGRTNGVVPGMKFFAIFPKGVNLLVEVTSVTDSSSKAYVITSRYKNHSEREVKLRVGWKLTSRAPRRAFEYYPG